MQARRVSSSPSGDNVAVGFADGSITVLDATSFEIQRDFKGESAAAVTVLHYSFGALGRVRLLAGPGIIPISSQTAAASWQGPTTGA